MEGATGWDFGNEDIPELWKALGMQFEGCRCLLGPHDAIVKSRQAEMKQANEAERFSGPRNPLPVLA